MLDWWPSVDPHIVLHSLNSGPVTCAHRQSDKEPAILRWLLRPPYQSQQIKGVAVAPLPPRRGGICWLGGVLVHREAEEHFSGDSAFGLCPLSHPHRGIHCEQTRQKVQFAHPERQQHRGSQEGFEFIHTGSPHKYRDLSDCRTRTFSTSEFGERGPSVGPMPNPLHGNSSDNNDAQYSEIRAGVRRGISLSVHVCMMTHAWKI